MDEFVGTTPIFPLPLGALLPGELLPLHIFEPRYRRMLEDMRKGDRMLGIATLMPGHDDENGNPPIADVVGIGRLIKDRTNPDGTSDIVLKGVLRGEVTGEVQGQPYRQALVRLHPEAEEHAALAFRRRRALLGGLADAVPHGELQYDITAEFQPGGLVDRIAASLELTAGDRVTMLQALSVDVRIEGLLLLLEQDRHRAKLATLVPSLAEYSLELRTPRP